MNKDCFQVTKEEIPDKINIYLYDGHHEEQDQYKALMHYIDFLDETFIFLVDDYTDNDPRPKIGTQRSIKDLSDKITVVKDWEFKPTYGQYKIHWDAKCRNGFYVCLITKNKMRGYNEKNFLSRRFKFKNSRN